MASNINIAKINSFLKEWANIACQNPNLDFLSESMSDAIYHDLVTIGVPERDKKVCLNPQSSQVVTAGSFFDKWTQYYSKNKKINCFVSPSWQYFCQFISKDDTAACQSNNIKVYVPLDAAHIEKGAIEIFDFLTKKQISHQSKIGKKIRFDDIVIRLANKKDAEKLLNFISKSKYIQEGLITPNPFAYNEGNIALACDGSFSYNEIVSQLIALYIDNKKKSNQLSNVSYYDFYNHIYKLYKEQFIDKTDNTLKNFFKFEKDEMDSSETYRNIIKLIINCQHSSFDWQQYINHYHGQDQHKHPVPNIESLLSTCIETMTERFQSRATALATIEAYLIDGDSRHITRQNNLRETFINIDMKSEVTKLLKERKITFTDLCNELTISTQK